MNRSAIVGQDCWGRLEPQPIELSLQIQSDIGLTGATDQLQHSINYDKLSRHITQYIKSVESFKDLNLLARGVTKKVIEEEPTVEWFELSIGLPKALLRADSANIGVTWVKKGKREHDSQMQITNLRLNTIIGIEDAERLQKQNVVVNLSYTQPETTNGQTLNQIDAANTPSNNFEDIAKTVTDYVEKSSYLTIEALVTSVARIVCVDCQMDKITVKVEKPSAMSFAASAAIEITRTGASFRRTPSSSPKTFGNSLHHAYIALGSNIGEKLGFITEALKEMSNRGLKVLRTSSLYESAPMYYTEQEPFLNGVCSIATILSPEDLLAELKDIENKLGRVKLVENGPRNIDLDILLYDNDSISLPHLIVPHLHMLEREFVLRPLCDIAPNVAHPHTLTTFKSHLLQLRGQSTVTEVVRLSSNLPNITPTISNKTTSIMAIINVTPDSFSDGGLHTQENLLAKLSEAILQGATIIDIGGVSTRPNADEVSESEEMDRVIPAIEAIRACQDDSIRHITISVDTFRASVAKAAIRTGANIINDVSGGTMDPDMFSTVATLDVPIIIMHMRGTPKTMTSLTSYPDGLIETVGSELEERVNAASEAGIKRWNIILDPGIGFAKNQEQNLELLRRFSELRNREALGGIPWLLGTSRKKFIGTITGVKDASQRQWG